MASTNGNDLDVVVVGAGFAGLYMLHRLRALGLRARVFEAGSGVGGTWFWNRYPGARCDIASMEYSYQFDDGLAQEWQWSERYAPQPEILRYIEHVAARFDLHRDVQLSTSVVSARFQEPDRWLVETDSGSVVSCRYCIMAVGCLSTANLPNIVGLDTFEGESYHTGRWPAEGVDLKGRRVAVIGTGSSGVQAIPKIAEGAREVRVLQRTAGYVVPARNRPLSEVEAAQVTDRYRAFRSEATVTHNGHHPGPLGVGVQAAAVVSEEERRMEFERRWAQGGLAFLTAFTDLLSDDGASASASEFVRAKIRSIVKDPATAELLCPRFPIGGKRLCVGTDYYEAYNLPSVHLVDASAGIETLTPAGIRLADGREFEVDCMVYATGYDAITGSLLKMDLRGRNGVALREKWSAGPVTYLGMATAGFPNLFMITGPGSPSVLTNMVQSIEHHVDWIAECLRHASASGTASGGSGTIEASAAAELAWTDRVRTMAAQTVRGSGAVDSWYLGANVPGKPRVFLPYTGGFPDYVAQCADVVAQGYKGFLR